MICRFLAPIGHSPLASFFTLAGIRREYEKGTPATALAPVRLLLYHQAMARRPLPPSCPDPDQFDLLDLPEPTAVLLTYSGRTVNLERPDFSRFEIEDIARPLAYQCRFVGNTRAFYSVAQHCVLASELAPAAFAFDALMHDSEEAFTGDWPTPWKIRIGRAAIRDAIAPLKDALAERFGFRCPEPEVVKIADRRALATELRDLCAPHRLNWRDLPAPAETTIVPLGPDQAMAQFLERYQALTATRPPPLHRRR